MSKENNKSSQPWKLFEAEIRNKLLPLLEIGERENYRLSLKPIEQNMPNVGVFNGSLKTKRWASEFTLAWEPRKTMVLTMSSTDAFPYPMMIITDALIDAEAYRPFCMYEMNDGNDTVIEWSANNSRARLTELNTLEKNGSISGLCNYTGRIRNMQGVQDHM
jgi:hypothetical protein